MAAQDRSGAAAPRWRAAGRAPSIEGLLAVVLILVAGCGGIADRTDRPGDVAVELHTEQPRYAADAVPRLTVVVRNGGSVPCALPSAALASVEIVAVRRDGATVIGRPGREYHFLGVTAVVVKSLRAVPPGGSLTVPVDAGLDADHRPVLGSGRRTESDVARTTGWTLDQPGHYRVTARLAPPPEVRRPDVPALCHVPSPTATTDFEMTS